MKSIDLDRKSVYEASLYMQTLLRIATCRFNPQSVYSSPKNPPPLSPIICNMKSTIVTRFLNDLCEYTKV